MCLFFGCSTAVLSHGEVVSRRRFGTVCGRSGSDCDRARVALFFVSWGMIVASSLQLHVKKKGECSFSVCLGLCCFGGCCWSVSSFSVDYSTCEQFSWPLLLDCDAALEQKTRPGRQGYFPWLWRSIKKDGKLSTSAIHPHFTKCCICHEMTLQHIHILHLPRKVALQQHQILYLPQKVTVQHYQMSRLPRKVTPQHHQKLHFCQEKWHSNMTKWYACHEKSDVSDGSEVVCKRCEWCVMWDVKCAWCELPLPRTTLPWVTLLWATLFWTTLIWVSLTLSSTLSYCALILCCELHYSELFHCELFYSELLFSEPVFTILSYSTVS